MSFSSRRRNYLLTPHRRDGLIEWMKCMLQHSFVLDALDSTGADTFSHFEVLIEEHRQSSSNDTTTSTPDHQLSRLKRLVPTVGTFHTPLPLRRAFEVYNAKYALTTRKHITISFNEIRHILNLAQIMALSDANSNQSEDCHEDVVRRWQNGHDSPSALVSGFGESPPSLSLDGVEEEESPEESSQQSQQPKEFKGPMLISFDGDQTLYSDGSNFESNPKLAGYLYLLLRHGVAVAVVTAAGYEYQTEKYELRLSGLLAFFQKKGLPPEDCERFYLFGGECNYLLRMGDDYKLHPVKEFGPGGWITATKHIKGTPGSWNDVDITNLLNVAEESIQTSMEEQKLRARVIRKKRAIGLVPKAEERMPREALDEAVLRVQAKLDQDGVTLPFCAFNGGRDAWVDVGNKRVGVEILQSYLGVPLEKTLHIGDQFLNTGNDYAARTVCPCVWITSPDETTYILKSILRLANISLDAMLRANSMDETDMDSGNGDTPATGKSLDFAEMERRTKMVELMDVYTGEILRKASAS
mmetsp:Transcript_24513/g.35892  ORF Transcript_24513/g.35892 Transcript_24513/m.35892 type:complete len:526 (+) Transcript_24513:203-1780(+)